jgi:beta-lactamase class A
MSSASDYNRFLIAVWSGEVPYANEIKRLMGLANPGRSGEIMSCTNVCHKSGTTARMCGDMAILESTGKYGLHAYTFIGIIDRDDSVDDYLRWRRIKIDVIRKASTMVYDAMKSMYKYS